MWLLTRSSNKQDFQGHKSLTINGHCFKIKRINPLTDFTADRMPQIFASSYYQKPKLEGEKPHAEYVKRVMRDMMAVVEAGLVEPDLVPIGQGEKKGKEPGITVEDIARDEDTFTKLYWEIWLHSLNKFRGFKNFFFNLRLRYWLWTALRGATGKNPQPSLGLKEVSP